MRKEGCEAGRGVQSRVQTRLECVDGERRVCNVRQQVSRVYFERHGGIAWPCSAASCGRPGGGDCGGGASRTRAEC